MICICICHVICICFKPCRPPGGCLRAVGVMWRRGICVVVLDSNNGEGPFVSGWDSGRRGRMCGCSHGGKPHRAILVWWRTRQLFPDFRNPHPNSLALTVGFLRAGGVWLWGRPHRCPRHQPHHPGPRHLNFNVTTNVLPYHQSLLQYQSLKPLPPIKLHSQPSHYHHKLHP